MIIISKNYRFIYGITSSNFIREFSTTWTWHYTRRQLLVKLFAENSCDEISVGLKLRDSEVSKEVVNSFSCRLTNTNFHKQHKHHKFLNNLSTEEANMITLLSRRLPVSLVKHRAPYQTSLAVDDSRVVSQLSYTGTSMQPSGTEKCLQSIYCFNSIQLDDIFQVRDECVHLPMQNAKTVCPMACGLSDKVENVKNSPSQLNVQALGKISASFRLSQHATENNVYQTDNRNVNPAYVSDLAEESKIDRMKWFRHVVPLSSSVLFCEQLNSDSIKQKTSNNDQPSLEQLEAIQRHFAEHAPNFFVKMFDYRPYHLNIVFENNLFEKKYVKKGIAAYIVDLKKYVVYAHFRYVNVRMHVLKITVDESDGTVMVRWRVSGLPQTRLLQFWKFFPGKFKKNLDDLSEWIDGFSTFYIGTDGLIHKHRAERVIPEKSPEVQKVSPLAAHIAAAVNPGT